MMTFAVAVESAANDAIDVVLDVSLGFAVLAVVAVIIVPMRIAYKSLGHVERDIDMMAFCYAHYWKCCYY